MTQRFHDLNNEQAHGHLCVSCRADFTASGIDRTEVGVSDTTREPVFACTGACAAAAPRLHDPGEQLPLGAE